MQAGFRRAGLTVLAGSIGGFGVTLLLTPAISRLFTPGTFGTFATITALTSVFVGVSTFRLEVLAQRTADDTEAHDLLTLALTCALGWGLLVTLAMAASTLVFRTSLWWLLAGPLVVVASLQLVGSAALTRRGDYRALAVRNFLQGAGVGVVQVVLGLAGLGLGALVAGFATARLVWCGVVAAKLRPRRGLRRRWSSSRRFALVSGGSAFINSCAGQLPILLCAALFGQVQVGFLAMAIRVLVAPLSIVGQAAAAANIGEVGRALREGEAAAAAGVVKSGMLDLLKVGLLACGLAALLGVWAVPFLLGEQWTTAGQIVALLAVGTLAQFVVAPFSQLLNLTGRSRWLLGWDIARFALVGASFGVSGLLGANLNVAVTGYSIVLVLVYLILVRMVVLAVRDVHV